MPRSAVRAAPSAFFNPLRARRPRHRCRKPPAFGPNAHALAVHITGCAARFPICSGRKSGEEVSVRDRFSPVMITSFAFHPRPESAVVARSSQLARRDVGTPAFGGKLLAALIGIFAIPPLHVCVGVSQPDLNGKIVGGRRKPLSRYSAKGSALRERLPASDTTHWDLIQPTLLILSERTGGDLQLGGVLARLKCEMCGKRRSGNGQTCAVANHFEMKSPAGGAGRPLG